MQAIERMRRALAEFQIAGELTTNLDFHRWMMDHPRFLAGDFDTNFINQEWHPGAEAAEEDPERARRDRPGRACAQTQQQSRQRSACRRAAGPARFAMEDASAGSMCLR